MPAAVLVAPFAQAGTTPPFTIGPNPNAVVPAPDLDETADAIEDPEGNIKELGPLNQNTTKIGVIHNDPVPTLGFTNPNGQVDLRRAWLTSEKDGDGDDWIYFAWERDSSNGSGFVAFEFMQNAAPAICGDYDPNDTTIVEGCNPWANRDGDTDFVDLNNDGDALDAGESDGPDVGDFLILWDQQGNSLDLFYRKWVGTAPNLTLTPAIALPASVAVAAYGHDGFRGEAAINVTDVVFGGVATCLAFANIIPSTVTGNSDSADYKDTILQPGVDLANCVSDVTTTPKLADGTTNVPTPFPITTAGVVEVKDSALITVSGATAPVGGTIDFRLCEANTSGTATPPTSACDPGGASVLIDDDKAVTDSDGDGYFPTTVVSSSAWVTKAGRYCWKATFTAPANSGFLGDSDVSTGECFVVDPVTPTLSTTAGDDVVLGNAVTDVATLGGTAPKPTANVIETSAPNPATRTAAGGSIRFKLIGPDNCTSVAYDSDATTPKENATVSGDGPYNASTTPTAAGDYHWVAIYSGDSPNTNGRTHNADCSDTAEDVTVMTVTPTLATAQSWVPNDSATITASAGGDLTGNVSFTLYPSSDCTGTPVYGPVDVPMPANAGLSETVSTSNTTAITTATNASFSWSVSYDSTNPAQDDLAATCTEVSTLTINNSYVQP